MCDCNACECVNRRCGSYGSRYTLSKFLVDATSVGVGGVVATLCVLNPYTASAGIMNVGLGIVGAMTGLVPTFAGTEKVRTTDCCGLFRPKPPAGLTDGDFLLGLPVLSALTIVPLARPEDNNSKAGYRSDPMQ